VLRRGGLLFALLFAAPACAQVSGSVTLLSDYRYHGASLSDESPTAKLVLAWDRGDGWYAGAQLARVRFVYPGARSELQAVPYLGYVRVLRPGLSAEAGVQYSWFSRSAGYGYPEIYLGLSGEHLGTRVSWIHDYFGEAPAWYAEVNGSRPLRDALRLVSHIGVLRQNTYSESDAGHWRYDVAAGMAFTVGDFDLQATWTTASDAGADDACTPWQCGSRNAWVLQISRTW
jgi:uncharacterized protein (TIGR02001 family)